MDTLTDRTLILRSRRGDTAAYGELVGRYQQGVFNVCYRLLGNRQDAEDGAQDAFVRAYGKLDLFDEARPFGPWMRRVAANLSLNALKRRPAAVLALDEEFDEVAEVGGKTPEGSRIEAENSAEIRSLLLTLPDTLRAALELRHFHDMSYAEMAKVLGLPLNTAKSHLFRARKLLARRMRENGYERS